MSVAVITRSQGDAWINTLRILSVAAAKKVLSPHCPYLCKLISWILLLPAYCCCLCRWCQPLCRARDSPLCQLLLQTIDFSAPLALMNGQSCKVYLSHTHAGTCTHTHPVVNLLVITVDVCQGVPWPWLMQRVRVHFGPGLVYIKWNARLVLAPDFSRIQTVSRGFARQT